MSLSQIELTCTSSDIPSAFTVGERYPAYYAGASVYHVRSNRAKRHNVVVDDNGNGIVWEGDVKAVLFKHLVTLNNESL